MLKRPPTRVELKPEDRHELDAAQRIARRGKAASSGAEVRKTAAQRIGHVVPEPSPQGIRHMR